MLQNSYHTINYAPVVLFVYNRLDHTSQTVRSLRENNLASETELYIYSDGGKSENDESVRAVREFIRTVDGFKSVTIIERKENWGLAKSIIKGVTDVVDRFGKVIVLEDDIVTSPYFLQFMNDALVAYENQNRVMHISGYMYPVKREGLPSTFFVRPTSCWGWATWARAWKEFKKDTDYYLDVFDRKMIKQFNLNGAYDYFGQIRANKSGKIDTWAIYWYASCFLNDGLSLHPKISFVSNIGNDNSGVNCEQTDSFIVDIAQTPVHSFETCIEEHKLATARLTAYFNSIKSFSILRGIRRLLVKLLVKKE